ncbi:type II secretion system protein [bacterium]|nr:type II secretion system protein [bacterium]
MTKFRKGFIEQNRTTGVNKGSRLGLLPQHVKFPSPSGKYKAYQNFCHSELYKANRHSGARTCEPVCRAVSESSKILSEPVCRAVSESNQIDRCRNEFGMTEKTSSLRDSAEQKHPVNVSARGKIEVGANPVRGKAAFTLAEGATHTNTPPLVAKAAFTLAEVLITLAVIGVVAALTLPTLIAKVNEKVDQNQIKVTRAKLFQGIKMLDLHGGVNNTYSSTAEFVEELSKYMKITHICNGTNVAFRECIPYSEIKYTSNDEDKTVEVSKLNTANSLSLGTVDDTTEFMAPVALVLGDGTPILLSYNKKCISDPDSITENDISSDGLARIHPCIAGIFDINGSRTPNRVGKDIQYMNSAKIKDAALATIAGYDIIKQADTPPAMDCSKYKGNAKYPEIKHCPYEGEVDYWVGAVVTCRDMDGHLPSMEELADIAKVIYPNVTSGEAIDKYSGWSNGSWNTTEAAKLGIDTSSSYSYSYMWSSEEKSTTSYSSRRRYFGSGTTVGGDSDRRSGYSFVCLAD